MYKPIFDRQVVWYEKQGTDFTGRTICVLWHGDKRYIGVAKFVRKAKPSKVGRPDQVLGLSFQGRKFKLNLDADRKGNSHSKHVARAVAVGRALYVAAIDQGLTPKRKPGDGNNQWTRFHDLGKVIPGLMTLSDIPSWMLRAAPRPAAGAETQVGASP